MHTLKRKPVHPGEILLEEFIKPYNLKLTELAKHLDVSFRTISELVNEKRNVSVDMAIRLSKYFTTSVDFWMNLQNQYSYNKELIKYKDRFKKIIPIKLTLKNKTEF
jgi:addiction module HigA family antidote